VLHTFPEEGVRCFDQLPGPMKAYLSNLGDRRVRTLQPDQSMNPFFAVYIGHTALKRAEVDFDLKFVPPLFLGVPYPPFCSTSPDAGAPCGLICPRHAPDSSD